jgi:hypothetical protein
MKKVIVLFLFLSNVFTYSQSNVEGKNIHSLIGKEFFKLENEIVFEEYVIKQGGGYLLQRDNFDAQFGINFYSSDEKHFLLFSKFSNSRHKILDIIEINKKDFQGKKITEYCSTKKGWSTEIIALVNNTNTEFYTKILKAWRANRKSEKFEKVRPKKIINCGNESFGI